MRELQALTLSVSRLNHRVIHWMAPGRACLLLHGAVGNGRWWDGLVQRLNNFDVYAPDMKGHGDSDKPASGYSLTEVADDIAGLVDTLQLDRPIIIAHSYAAKAAMVYSAQHAKRLSALVLVDPTPAESMSLSAEAIEFSLRPFIAELGPHSSWGVALETARHLPQFRRWDLNMERAFRYGMEMLSDGSVGGKTSLAILRQIAFQAAKTDITSVLSQMTVRTLLVTASETEAVLGHGQKLSAMLPQATWHVLEGNHWIYTDNPAAFTSTLLTFLQSLA